MAFTGIEEITRAEQRWREEYESAVTQAKHALVVEQRVGERLLEDVRKNEEVEARRLIAEAEAAAAAHSEQLLRAEREECERMEAEARSRLDAAAALIVEKVVND